MDRQFAHILMLSVLLPAGAALAEAMQHEQTSFAAMEHGVMSNIAGTPSAEAARETVPEIGKRERAALALKDRKPAGNAAKVREGY
jgi:hypothetical protein